MTRVLVVDDQPLIREGFRMILSAQPDLEVVGEACDGVTAVAGVEAVQPDVVLMDVRMPGMDGIEATRRVRAERVHGRVPPRVLVLTTFGFDEYVVEALRAGASGFLLKDATPEELVHAVRVVAAGHALLAPAVTSRLIETVLPRLVSPGSSLARQRSALDQLTEREREVLMLVARGQSNAEIGTSLSISDATVKTHVSHVLTKLDLRDRVQAVIAAYELGLLTPGAP